jgi:hypothetical protein
VQKSLRNCKNLKRMLQKCGCFDCVIGFYDGIVQQRESSIDASLRLGDSR